MKVLIRDISTLQFGLYSKPKEDAGVFYLQANHFDDMGQLTGEADTFVEVNKKSQAHLLQDGDVLLAAKGFRNFAWTYKEAIGPAIASSIFFVIRPDKSKIIPEFLTTLLNLPEYQSQLQTLGAGSSVHSIRKAELEALPITVPSLQVQAAIVEIKGLHQNDLDISQKIISEKQKLYAAAIKKLITTDNE